MSSPEKSLPARRRTRAVLLAAILALAGAVLLAVGAAGAQRSEGFAYSLSLTGSVDPANERWLDTALGEAEQSGAELAIVRLDTPGGLDESMRSMVKRITGASLPVVVFVAPEGARATSAGLFVLQAADVAAMSPQTNVGAATPILLAPGEEDEVLGRKLRNDAAAYVSALAQGHGRRPALAERMVREAVSAPASEAREAGLIDVVAADERQLLRRVDGFELKGPKGQTLRTEGLRVERHDTPLHYELLQTLVDPTIASLLLLIGAAGIAIEILSPGAIAPGVAGAIALILGLYGSALLPVTAAGVALLLLALGLIAAETQIPSGGILGGAGVAALVAGLLVLYDTDSEALRVSVPAAVAAGVLLGGLVLFAASKGLAARKAPPRGEAGDLVGASGVVRAPLDPVGQVLVSGALWRAKTAEERGVPRGARVEVRSVDGLTLTVQPEDNHEQQRSDT